MPQSWCIWATFGKRSTGHTEAALAPSPKCGTRPWLVPGVAYQFLGPETTPCLSSPPPSSWMNLPRGHVGRDRCNSTDHCLLEITCNKHSRIFSILKRKCKNNCHSLPNSPNVGVWPQPTGVYTHISLHLSRVTLPDSLTGNQKTEVQESHDKLLANYHTSSIWVNILDHKVVPCPLINL